MMYCENAKHAHGSRRKRCCDGCCKCPSDVGALRTVKHRGISYRLCKSCAATVNGYKE